MLTNHLYPSLGASYSYDSVARLTGVAPSGDVQGLNWDKVLVIVPDIAATRRVAIRSPIFSKATGWTYGAVLVSGAFLAMIPWVASLAKPGTTVCEATPMMNSAG